MSLQDIFYILAIIFLFLASWAILFFIIFLWRLQKMRERFMHFMNFRNLQIPGIIGATLAGFILERFRKIFRRD